MAVRLDASGEYLLRTANLPSHTAVTICGWAQMSADRNIETALCSIESGTASASSYIILATNADGTALKVWNAAGEGTTFATIAVGTPFFFALTSSGTAAANMVGYYRAVNSNTLSSGNSPGTGVTFTPGALFVGNDSYNEWFNGRIWNVKVWDRALSATELLIESFYERPQFPTSLNLWLPLPNANDTADRSGNGRNPTIGGTFTTEDSTVNLWRPSAELFIPAAGGTSGSVGIASESDSAVARGAARPAGVCTTTDTALALVGLQVRAAGLAAESDQALALLPAINGAVGAAVESDVALALGAGRPAGLAVESDAALALAVVQARAAGLATEADTAFAMAAVQLRATGVAIETDSALGLSAGGAVPVGLAVETDTAFALDSVSVPQIVIPQTSFSEFSGAIVKTKQEPRQPRVKVPKAARQAKREEAKRLEPVLAPVGLAVETAEALALQSFVVQRGLLRTVPIASTKRASPEDRLAYLEREVSALRRALASVRAK